MPIDPKFDVEIFFHEPSMEYVAVVGDSWKTPERKYRHISGLGPTRAEAVIELEKAMELLEDL